MVSNKTGIQCKKQTSLHTRAFIDRCPLSRCCVIIGRILPESAGVRRPSGPEFTAEELDDLNIALQLPELSDVIPKDELRRLKKDEKKRQELINGNIIVVC